MNKKFCKVYNQGDISDSAFLLVEGDVFLYVNESDKYAVKGKNFIFGTSELFLKNNLGLPVSRLETAIMPNGCSIKRVSGENFVNSLEKYSFVLNSSMFIARQVLLTNELINKSSTQMKSGQQSNKDVCISYYRIISILKAEYEKRKLPWMKEILSKYELSLAFKQGEIFFKASEPVKMSAPEELDGKTKSYPQGSTVIEQGEQGDDMLILKDGMLDVVVNGNKVAVIKDPGTPVGEIALLLGEKRSASLIAKNNAVVTRISRSDLKELSKKDNSLFINIAESLSQKHYNNILKLRELNEKAVGEELDSNSEEKEKETRSRLKNSAELGALKKEISEIAYHKKADYLKEALADYIKF